MMKKSSIYTRTGDSGTTSLIGGTRIEKNSIQLEAYGTIDELNSYIGLLRTYIVNSHDNEFLLNIQNILFYVGSSLATDILKVKTSTSPKIPAKNIKSIEQEIDIINQQLPINKSFIIPGGCREAAIAHVCRTICRKAERRIYSFQKENFCVDTELMSFINRLSDYFFIFARKVNLDNKNNEILWNNTCI